MRVFSTLLLAGAVLWVAPATSLAAGEHGRRVAAELLVVAGDVARLSRKGLSRPERKGLRERIAGALSGLELMLRLADEERGRPPDAAGHRRSVAELRAAFGQNDLTGLAAALETLIARYPLDIPAILPAIETAERLARGKGLHERLCAACHDAPRDEAVERPARSLFAEARALSSREFAARLLIGVRGDVVTGIGNPFSDEQIASLIVYYRKGRGE